MRTGRNEVTGAEDRAHGRDREFGELRLRNHSIDGPLLSGPYQTPFIWRITASGLGAPTDPGHLLGPTQVSWFYRATNNAFKPLADPADRPGWSSRPSRPSGCGRSSRMGSATTASAASDSGG